MNTTANKFYRLSGKISLLAFIYDFVHYKKLMKVQFLKNGKTYVFTRTGYCAKSLV